MSRGLALRGYQPMCSDRLWAFCYNQHRQHRCYTPNVPRNRQECFRNRHMPFCQSLKPGAYIVELIDFAQDRCKRHGQTPRLLKKPKMGKLQMDWLRSEDLKEEKNVTAPIIIIARMGFCGSLRPSTQGKSVYHPAV